MENETSVANTAKLDMQAFPEKLLTLDVIANRLGLPDFKVHRAARAGLFPTYTLFNSRKLARMSEVLIAIERTQRGAS